MLKVLMNIWPIKSIVKKYKQNKEFNKKLAELKKRDPFDDGDE